MLSATNVNSIFPFIRAILQEVRQKFDVQCILMYILNKLIKFWIAFLTIPLFVSPSCVKMVSSSAWSFVLMPWSLAFPVMSPQSP